MSSPESDSEGSAGSFGSSRFPSPAKLRGHVELTKKRASEAVARLNARVDTFRREWYDRIDPFLYYDHTYPYRLIPELWLTALSFLFFVLCIFLMALVGGIADYRHPGAYRLPDIGFVIIPEMTSYPNLPNDIGILSFFLTAALVSMHPKRLMVFRRSLVIYGIIIFLRAACVVATALPDPSPQCAQTKSFLEHAQGLHKISEIEDQRIDGSFWRGLKQAMNPFKTSTCGDLIFSGHTVAFLLCSLIWDRYFTGKRSRWPVYLYHLVTISGILSILAVRFHYTIDVVVAVIITILVWQRYHIFVDYRQLYMEANSMSSDEGGQGEGKGEGEGGKHKELERLREIHEKDGIIRVIETGDYTHLLPRKEGHVSRRRKSD